MSILVICVLASVPSLQGQDDSPRSTLTKIENVILNAKTLTFTYRSDYTMRKKTGRSKGSVLLGQGNTLVLQRQVTDAKTTSVESVISDGSQVSISRGSRTTVHSAPSRLGSRFRAELARFGSPMTWCGIGDFSIADVDHEKELVVKEVKAGPDDGDAKTLKYLLTHHNAGTHWFRIKVWYDPTTFRPLKCERRFFEGLITRSGKEHGVTTVTIERLTLGEDIPASKFALPKK